MSWASWTYVRILMPAGDWVANGFIDLISVLRRLSGRRP